MTRSRKLFAIFFCFGKLLLTSHNLKADSWVVPHALELFGVHSYNNIMAVGTYLKSVNRAMLVGLCIPRYSTDVTKLLEVDISGRSKTTPHCRIWVNKLDRKDGSFIVRYKIYETCLDLQINVLYKHKHVEGSPYKFKGLYVLTCILLYPH